jgi:hypothetical protein
MAMNDPNGLSDLTRVLEAVIVPVLPAIRVDGASVASTRADDAVELLWRSGDTAARLSNLQFTIGEGPAVQASRLGRPVLVGDLHDVGGWASGGLGQPGSLQWPALMEGAERLGVRSVFALPLQIGVSKMGVLELYRSERGELDDQQLAQALRLSDAVGYAMLSHAALRRTLQGDDSSEKVWTPSAMRTRKGSSDPDATSATELLRAVMHQATGMLSVQLVIPLDEALVRLRAFAFAQNRSIMDVSRDIVHHAQRIEG